MSRVAICKCNQYDLELVKTKINESFDLLGGIDSLIKKDAKVFIKINGVGPFPPEMAITTHPIFVQAVIQLVKIRTNNILIGDNPATKDIVYVLKKTGIFDIITQEKIKIFDGKSLTSITNSSPKIYQSFEVSKEMIEVDVFINLPKLKTHALTYMTVAQKNLFGLIYGLNKASWHVKANNPLQFGEAFNDLYGAILEKFKDKNIIHICDGIIGLEGEGPSTGGFPKPGNVILTSLDAVSLDRVAVEVAGLDFHKLFINKIADERKYGQGSLKQIEILGESIENFNDLKFVEPTNPLSIFGMRLLRYKFIRNIILEHPKIDLSICIKCGECAKICPPKALKINKRQFPTLQKVDCIRCWCCAEVCPQNAIKKSKRPVIGKIVLKNRI